MVFDTSGSYNDERHNVAPGNRWRARRGHDGSTARKKTEGPTAFWEAQHVAGRVSRNEPTEEHGMWDRGGRGLHAMDDDDKMDEDKEKTDSKEIGDDEEQEEEHQKARAMASPDSPSRREVEDHNLTHIPFRSWCNHWLRGRGRKGAHKRRHSEGEGADNRAVTDYVYLTGEGREDEVDAEEGAARGSTTLGRPIIVGVDRKTGGVHTK